MLKNCNFQVRVGLILAVYFGRKKQWNFFLTNLKTIFALDHWRVEIPTHWPNLASAILKQLAKMVR